MEACNTQEKFIIVGRLRMSHLLLLMDKGGCQVRDSVHYVRDSVIILGYVRLWPPA